MENRKEEFIPPEIIIKDRKRKLLEKEDMTFFFEKLFGIIILLVIVFKTIYGIHIVEGQDMYPAIKDGDVAIYFRINGQYNINDVIAINKDKIRLLSRIVAKAGDVVDITEDGLLKINGNVQQEEIYFQTYPDNVNTMFPYKVSENCVFVLGDYRTGAQDSRLFGEVNIKEIEGKVISIIRRRGF